MATIPIKRPEVSEMITFIAQTHACEKLKVKLEEINGMMKEGPKYKMPNPHVIAHFEALNYLLSLAGTPDFPCKDARLLTSHYKSDDRLYWFRKLHEKMTFSLCKSTRPEWMDEVALVKQNECGAYRNVPATLAFDYAPHHEDIPKILHVWLSEAAAINDEVKDNFDNPHGITKAQAVRMEKFAHNSSLLCSNLLPFNYGNNRFGRLLENLFRIHWHLPWATVPDKYQDYIRDIQVFGEQEMPKYKSAIKDMR